MIEQGGDDALALKGNHPALLDDVRRVLDDPATPLASAGETDAGHGRIETRTASRGGDIEHGARNRKDHGPENRALLRRLALNLAKPEPSKGSICRKLKRAGWDTTFPADLLANATRPHMR